MFMNISAPGLDVGLKLGDAVDDRHGDDTSGLNASVPVACKGRSNQRYGRGTLSRHGRAWC
jgi:hypothetical protein